ncbi:MAG: type II toxin-antitoxin system VapC family toxin [Acidobacteria bacterium]|nr:type II toxin-antitoxin system VapC family toxin [Acidobacteriota bacterium]
MSGNSVALDTSVAIDVLAGRAESLTSQPVTEFLLPVPVVGELRYGALNSRKAEENLAEVERLVAKCRILDITAATADVYARLRLTLKTKGKPIPENDLWIAALCAEHQVKLAAVDGHFDAIDGLQRFEF